MRATRFLLLFLLLPFALATCRSPTFVWVQRLAPGGGGPADGGTYMSSEPALNIVVKVRSDATDFRPYDLMRLYVNGVDRSVDTVIGGDYAILTLVPPPIGTPQFVELYTLVGTEPLDTGTFVAEPYTGPVLLGVAPDSAQEGEQVVISGAGFAAGPLRVFFGGVEGTVDASDDTSITATVPAGAPPGLLYVLVGETAADGVVEFLPLDGMGVPVPLPGGLLLFAAFPGHGVPETPLVIWGANFDNDAYPEFTTRKWTRVLAVETIDLPLIGPVVRARAVVEAYTEPGAGEVRLVRGGAKSNYIPFTVD